MLPEGAQRLEFVGKSIFPFLTAKDYTTFMLNRKATDVKITLAEDDWEDLKKDTPVNDWEVVDEDQSKDPTISELSPEQLSTVFCYNLMHTKTEKSNVSNRGARIKAIAVGSRHQFFHIYKVPYHHFQALTSSAFHLDNFTEVFWR